MRVGGQPRLILLEQPTECRLTPHLAPTRRLGGLVGQSLDSCCAHWCVRPVPALARLCYLCNSADNRIETLLCSGVCGPRGHISAQGCARQGPLSDDQRATLSITTVTILCTQQPLHHADRQTDTWHCMCEDAPWPDVSQRAQGSCARFLRKLLTSAHFLPLRIASVSTSAVQLMTSRRVVHWGKRAYIQCCILSIHWPLASEMDEAESRCLVTITSPVHKTPVFTWCASSCQHAFLSSCKYLWHGMEGLGRQIRHETHTLMHLARLGHAYGKWDSYYCLLQP